MKHYLLCLLLMLIALLMSLGCKSRKVLTSHTDSVVKTSEAKHTAIKEASVDTGKTVTQKSINKQDGSTTTIEATPVPGKPVTINTDGSIIGEFTNIKSTNKRHTNTNQTEKTVDQKGISNMRTVDNSSTKKQETHFQKKIKDIATKPDYSWIWWVVIIIAAIIFGIYLFKRFSLWGLIAGKFKN